MYDRVALVTAVSVKVDSGTACNVELTRGEGMAHYGNTHVWRGYGLAETAAAMALRPDSHMLPLRCSHRITEDSKT
jgi:hypothetical protein